MFCTIYLKRLYVTGSLISFSVRNVLSNTISGLFLTKDFVLFVLNYKKKIQASHQIYLLN